MQEPNTQVFIDQVLREIRWKKAHKAVEKELRDHITDQAAVFRANGMDENLAQERAVEEMGDAVQVGTQLDRAYRPKPQWLMLALVGLLAVIGVVLRNQILGATVTTNQMAVLGLAVMVALYFTDYTILTKWPKAPFALLTMGTVVLLLVTPTLSGRNMYAQYTMLLFPIALIGIIYSMRGKGLWGMLVCGLCIVFTIALNGFLVSPSIVYLTTTTALMVAAQMKGWFGVKRNVGLGAIGAGIVAIAISVCIRIFSRPYILWRIADAFHPENNANGGGFASMIVRDVLGGAKFMGMGTSTQLSKLINIESDYFLAYLIGSLGWVSLLVIMAATIGLIGYGFYLCSRQKNSLGQLTSLAILLTLTGQVVLYLAANLGFSLFAPLNFPFISIGGAGMLVNLALVGLMLSTFRLGCVSAEPGPIAHQTRRIMIADGKLTIHFR